MRKTAPIDVSLNQKNYNTMNRRLPSVYKRSKKNSVSAFGKLLIYTIFDGTASADLLLLLSPWISRCQLREYLGYDYGHLTAESDICNAQTDL